MKSLIKRFTAVITAVIIFCFSVSPSFNVSAATSFVVPEKDVASDNFDPDFAAFACDTLVNSTVFLDSGFDADDFFISVSQLVSSVAPEAYVFPKDGLKIYNVSGNSNLLIVYSDTFFRMLFNSNNSLSSLSYITDNASARYPIALYYNINTGALGRCQIYSNRNSIFSYSGDVYSYFYGPLALPFIGPNLDDYDLNYVVKNLGIDKDGFFKWLVVTGKISDLHNIFGDVADNKMQVLIDYFDKYGSNSFSYVLNLPSLLVDLKLHALSVDLIKSSYNVFRSLYKEYQAFKGLKATDVVKYMQGKMQLIDPEDDTLPSLDTDSFVVKDDDTVSDSTLKRILMMLYYILNSINYNTERVINSIDNLSFDSYTDLSPVVNAINNKVIDNSQDIDVDFSADADRIITAINNINIPSGGSSTDISLDVTITDDKQQEINDFFQNWNVKYTEKINDKIPVVGQLSSLFNDSFFEKCGIDVDGDGEVYQYYNTNRSMTLYDLPASVPVQDAGTLAASSSAATSDEFMDSFFAQFDEADAHFLDDVYFTEDVPAFYVTIGGKRTEIFDFKLFAKYRTQVHTIMIFCIFTVYFLSLYKSLPGIIGNVSDVVNAFRNNSEE